MFKTITAFLAASALVASGLQRYDGFSSYRCSVTSEEEKKVVYSMSHLLNVDVIGRFTDSIDVLISKEQVPIYEALKCKVIVEDAQRQMENEDIRLEQSRDLYNNVNSLNDTDVFHKTYHTYDEISSKVRSIASQFPRVVRIASLGRSLLGRDTQVVHITGPSTVAKPTVFIMAGLHAREWIGPAVAVYTIQSLAEKYGVDSRVTALLDKVEIVIAPLTNPDGYIQSWDVDRMWRKNMNDNNGNACKGVDLNRNFDVYWGTQSSNSKCAQDYHGTSAASEPEVKNVQNYVASLKNKIGAIDIHSYGQYLMRPYGWTVAKHPNESKLKQVGDEMVQIIKQTTGAAYSSIRSAELYPVSGASDDWFTVKQNLWGFCFELRDKGLYGFRLPESNILPSGQEIYASIVHYAEFVLENF